MEDRGKSEAYTLGRLIGSDLMSVTYEGTRNADQQSVSVRVIDLEVRRCTRPSSPPRRGKRGHCAHTPADAHPRRVRGSRDALVRSDIPRTNVPPW